MRMFSVAMNGISSFRCRRITPGYTRPPEIRLRHSVRIASAARNASGRAMRRLAESSSVRSIHCVAAVHAGFSASVMT